MQFQTESFSGVNQMKIAFPVKQNNGLDSLIHDHFGTAALFLIADTQTGALEIRENQKLQDDTVKCKTGVFQKEDQVAAVVTRCMGDGSQRSLAAEKIQIYQAQKDTVRENLALLEKNELKLFHMFDFCQHKKNKKEGGCGHHH